jgi:hypothetical protein
MATFTVASMRSTVAKQLAAMKPSKAGGRGTPEFKQWSESVRRMASAICTNYQNKQDFLMEADYEDYTVLTRSLMNGEPVEIDAQQRGGVCDPGTETYWSM